MIGIESAEPAWRKSSYSNSSANCVEVAFVGAGWHKSSYSADTANCVEVAFVGAGWRKSSHSASTANCVEVAFADRRVAARDSKAPAGPALAWPESSWSVFLAGLCVKKL